MLEEINTFLKDNITLTIIVATISATIAFFVYQISRKKFRFEKAEFENKKPNFVLYLENCYKLQDSKIDDKLLLFDIRITNLSTTKNSVIPKLRIVYFVNNDKSEIVIDHNPKLFTNVSHTNLTQFSKEIRLEDREIKSGWVIFKFPQNLIDKRIDFYQLSIEDGSGNHSEIVCNLLKQIIYEVPKQQ